MTFRLSPSQHGRGLRSALLALLLSAAPGLRAEVGDRLFCASGIRESGPFVALVHVALVVPEGAAAERLGADALARLGARPRSAGGTSPLFVLSGHRWPQFFPGSTGEPVVLQHYNPTGQKLSGDADAALAAAARTWSGVRTSSFALALGERTSAVDGLDFLNVIDWPPTHSFGSGVLAITITTFNRATGEVLDADLLINPAEPFSLAPQLGDGTFDFQRVILHEDGHLAGLDHSPDPTAVMFATLDPGPQKHDLSQDEVNGLSTLYPVHFKAEPPPQPWPQPRRR